MLKKTMLIGMMCVSFLGISQTQCNELTKDSVQCKNTTKVELCYLHNPNYIKQIEKTTVICDGTTKKGKDCKNKTKDSSNLCHLHRRND